MSMSSKTIFLSDNKNILVPSNNQIGEYISAIKQFCINSDVKIEFESTAFGKVKGRKFGGILSMYVGEDELVKVGIDEDYQTSSIAERRCWLLLWFGYFRVAMREFDFKFHIVGRVLDDWKVRSKRLFYQMYELNRLESIKNLVELSKVNKININEEEEPKYDKSRLEKYKLSGVTLGLINNEYSRELVVSDCISMIPYAPLYSGESCVEVNYELNDERLMFGFLPTFDSYSEYFNDVLFDICGFRFGLCSNLLLFESNDRKIKFEDLTKTNYFYNLKRGARKLVPRESCFSLELCNSDSKTNYCQFGIGFKIKEVRSYLDFLIKYDKKEMKSFAMLGDCLVKLFISMVFMNTKFHNDIGVFLSNAWMAEFMRCVFYDEFDNLSGDNYMSNWVVATMFEAFFNNTSDLINLNFMVLYCIFCLMKICGKEVLERLSIRE